jgi:hypothetical protein
LEHTLVQGHPGDTYGYAGAAGFLLTDFLGLPGDTYGAQGAWGKGAIGYVSRATGTWFMRNGNNIAGNNIVDGLFADGTQVDLSTAWAVGTEYEHYWTPRLRTAAVAGFVAINYDQNAKNLICAGAPGYSLGIAPTTPNTPVLGLQNNSLGSGIASKNGMPSGFVNGWSPNSHCNPDSSWWQAATRTAYSPHPDLDIGLEILYTGLNTANKGATVNVGQASGAVPPGLYTFANQGIWTALFRVGRTFIP